MTQLYELVTAGPLPIKVKEVKNYLKLDSDVTEDDALLTGLLRTATRFGEKYTGMDFRANTWKLTIDDFEECIELRRSPVASITLVQNTVSGTLTTVVSTVYYLKKGTAWSWVLLDIDQSWPTTGEEQDGKQGTIEITFLTAATSCIDQAKTAMLRHIALMYECRGDCDDKVAALDSGATALYNQFRIERV